MRVLRGRLSICECASFPFGFKVGMWYLIALVYKTFFILNSVEHAILDAHKYKNIKKVGVFLRLR